MEEQRNVIVVNDVLLAVRAAIGNRQAERAKLWEKIIVLDGEISGLRVAEDTIGRAKDYNVSLQKE